MLKLLHRRVDVEDVVTAHERALERADAIGFGRYIVSATTPFTREDVAELRADAASAIRRRVPEADAVFAALGWRFPDSLDRIYVNARAREELGWEPAWDFRRALAAAAAGEEPRSALAVAIGAKGYHAQPTGIYTTR